MDGLAFDDMDEFARELDDPAAELEQDVVHMLLEAPYSNIDDPERSIGLNQLLSGVFDPRIANIIEEKLERDDRITKAKVTISANALVPGEYNVEIELQPADLTILLVRDANGNVRRDE